MFGIKITPRAAGVGLGVCMFAFVLLAMVSGCETLTPNAISLDAAHVDHHYGDTKAPYEFGKDMAGVGSHWKTGNLTVDAEVYEQYCKDGYHSEYSVKGSYLIPLK